MAIKYKSVEERHMAADAVYEKYRHLPNCPERIALWDKECQILRTPIGEVLAVSGRLIGNGGSANAPALTELRGVGRTQAGSAGQNKEKK